MNKAIEENEDIKRVIKLLYNSRVEQGAKSSQLCRGVCSISMLEKIERGYRNINRNCLNRLLARLGIDQKKYEKYLGANDYDEWKLRNDIINAIDDDSLEEAKQLLDKYKEVWVKSCTIEEQFYLFMQAQVLQHCENSENDDRIHELYREAMLITVPKLDKKNKSKLLLSADEINLILEYKSRELKSKDALEIFETYRMFINYIDDSQYDLGGKAKIYPKVVVYAYNHVKKYMKNLDDKNKEILYRKLLILCEKAVVILRKNNKAFYLDELFSAYIEVLSYMLAIDEDATKVANYKEILHQTKAKLKTYRAVCKQYGVESRMRDCCYMYREEDVYCINDVIKKRRIMLNIRAVDLCEGICSEKTYRRIETRERNPQESVVKAVFRRLGLSDEYINMGIVTDSKRVVELYEKYRYLMNAKELDVAEKILEKLDKELPSCMVNQKILLRAWSVMKWKKGEITMEQHIEDLQEVISHTVKPENIDKNNENKFYSWLEISSIYAMAVALKKTSKLQMAYECMEEVIDYYNQIEEEGLADVYIGSYEMVMHLYASVLGSMGRHEESNVVSDKLNKLFLKLKRTNILHLNVYNIAWNNKERGILRKEYHKEMEQCINLCQLTTKQNYENNYRKGM